MIACFKVEGRLYDVELPLEEEKKLRALWAMLRRGSKLELRRGVVHALIRASDEVPAHLDLTEQQARHLLIHLFANRAERRAFGVHLPYVPT